MSRENRGLGSGAGEMLLKKSRAPSIDGALLDKHKY